jgi:phage baseplate assembly protein W
VSDPQDLIANSMNNSMLDYIGKGIDFPFRFTISKKVGTIATTNAGDCINNSIHLILSTRIGERPFNLEFGCLAEGTMIPLLDGREVLIESLVGENNVWLYGCTSLGKIIPVKAPLGAVFSGEKEVIEVVLDNDSKIICTKNHPFQLRNGEYCEAQYLAPGNGLMPLHKEINKIGVVSVNYISKTQKVYDLINITPTFNFAVSAGVFVHNSRIPELTHEPNDIILSRMLKLYTADALNRWEKRIEILQITLVQNLDRDASRIGIVIYYRIRNSHIEGSYVYPFTKEGMSTGSLITGVESARMFEHGELR